MHTSSLKCHPRCICRQVAVLRRGFSLPEVTIAVAIAALGLVSILGLLPTGLENVRQAGANIATARICQEMISEIQSADWGTLPQPGSGSNVAFWDKLSKYNNAKRFFDGEGTLIGSSQVGGAVETMKLAYVAKYEFVALQPTQVLSTVGGSPPDANNRSDTLRVILHIATTTDQNYNFVTPIKDHVDRAFTVSRQF